MMAPSDVDFHPGNPDPLWCETNFFPFSIDDKGINAGIYVVARPNLGLCMSDITIQDRISTRISDQLYSDNQQYLACPSSFSNYNLDNGLSVEVIEPFSKYKIAYAGHSDTWFDLEFNSLMPPHDMNDPAQDPLAAARLGSDWLVGSAYSGHCDFSGRVTGTASLAGTRYDVDCLGTADRSWGVRSETGLGAANWSQACFGDDLIIQFMMSLDPLSTNKYYDLLTGYVLENGHVTGLVQVCGEYELFDELLPVSASIELTDARGRKFNLSGRAINGTGWSPAANAIYPSMYMEWTCNGRIGYGQHQHAHGFAYLEKRVSGIAQR